MKLSSNKLQEKSRLIRRDIVTAVATSGASHVGGALSCVDILTTLYFNVANINPNKLLMVNRDRIILSKGHGGLAQLATLAHRGFLAKRKLKKYFMDGTTFTGHTMKESAPGIEVTTGSLGHGLSLGIGMALAMRADHSEGRVYVILSDGEMDEGSTWEGILSAGHFKLDNLVVIVDYNKFQSFGKTSEVMNLEPLAAKFEAFNWQVKQIDGHDFPQLIASFSNLPFKKGFPSAIIAHTIKGKGVSYMENKLEWHYKSPNQAELKQALLELL